MAKIVLIDDDTDVADILSQILTKEGHEVVVYHDGERAVQDIAGIQPSLVITDMMLPKLDGWKICEMLREDPATTKISILLVTAKSDDIAKRITSESGADDYITKPFDNNELIAKVRELSSQTPS